MKIQKILLLLLLSFGLTISAYADSRNFSLNIHNTEINIRTPDGFYESSYIEPGVVEFFGEYFPDFISIKAVLLSERGFFEDDEGRFMLIGTLKSLDEHKISQNQFNDLRDKLKEQQYTLMNKIKDRANSALDDMSRSMSKDFDVDVSVKVNETTPLGVFYDNNNATALTTIINYGVSESLEVFENPPVVNTTAVLRVRSKLLYLYVYSNYITTQDIIWVEAKTKEFIDLLISKNK